LEKQIKVLLADHSIDLVDTGTYSINEIGDPIGIRGLEPIKYDARSVLDNAMLLHASVMGKKTWFQQNPYDPVYIRAEDRELWLRTYKSSKFARVGEPLYIVREGKVNIKNYVTSLKTMRKIIYKYGANILSKNELKAEVAKTYLKILLYKTFGMLNLQDLLSKRRNVGLSKIDKEKAISTLNKIKGTELPFA